MRTGPLPNDGCLGRDLGELLDALLDRADSIVRGLAHESAEILGLSDAGLQTAAPVLGRHVEGFDRRLSLPRPILDLTHARLSWEILMMQGRFL